jgi:hypothetical protein
MDIIQKMELRNQILSEHTKANCQLIVEWVGDDPVRFNELFNLFLHDENRVTQRAAWPMSYCAIAHPSLMKKNMGKLIINLQKPNLHNSIKRNTLRLLQTIDIPLKYEGVMMNLCFKYAEDPKEAVAIKAFSLTILGKLAKKYPEIIPEIKLLIEEQFATHTPGFRSRAKKVLKELIILE